MNFFARIILAACMLLQTLPASVQPPCAPQEKAPRCTCCCRDDAPASGAPCCCSTPDTTEPNQAPPSPAPRADLTLVHVFLPPAPLQSLLPAVPAPLFRPEPERDPPAPPPANRQASLCVWVV